MGSLPSRDTTKSNLRADVLKAIKQDDINFLSSMKDNSEESDQYRQTFPPFLLHYAAQHGRVEWVKYLIEQNFNVNSLTEGKETPLHSCVRAQHNGVQCAKIILEEKSDINAQNVWGHSPIMEAVVQFKFEMVDYLLSEGADVQLPDDNKTTPLHVCASYGNIGYLKKLLDRGADQNAQDGRGRTPLYFAINGNHKRVIEFFIQNGCNVNLYDSNFGSPLQKAITMSNIDLVQQLLKVGANTSMYNISRMSNVKLSLSELALHTVQVSVELVGPTEDEDGDLYGPAAKAFRHIQCFKLLLIAHGLPVPKDIRDRIRQIIQKCKVERLKMELLKVQTLANSMAQLSAKRPVDSLQNVSRLQCRIYLMRSKRNVIWACDQMDVPHILKNILTFKL